MCGITGFFSKNFLKTDLVKMTDALSHRGPDASGYFFDQDKGVALGHRRLSIIDLSDAANQPMTSHCGRYIMVYNGEVYNFKEMAKRLKKTNWQTSSDSEVILEAFVEWGIDFVHQLNGMFAIAIYDKKEDKLLLFRDRMGIKPLYYFYNKKELIFSSELKAICAIKNNLEISHNAIYAYLHLGYIPNNQTIYHEIFKLKQGSYLTYQKGKLLNKSYWKAENKVKKEVKQNIVESKKELKSLLQVSIEKRLISDVPIGTFLSGGIDSSIVAAVAQEVNNSAINTFSIGFDDKKHNESIHAKKVANYLGTNHNEFILKEQDAIHELENIMDHFDEPFADSSALPTMLVSRMAKKHVTVCLSGDGGDELFMGYGAYIWAKRINNPILGTLRQPISKILEKSNNNKLKRGAQVFKSPNKNWKSHIFSQEQSLFSEEEIIELLKKNPNNAIINNLNSTLDLNRKFSHSEQQAFFDLNYYLIDDLLVKVDRSSMYSSIEARVPLLDHQVVEFALNLDERFKINKGIQKYILKELTYDYIPEKMMERPKWGFSVPLEKWLKTELNYLIGKYLNLDSLSKTNILNIKAVANLLKRFNNGESFLYNRIWCLIILQHFLIKHYES